MTKVTCWYKYNVNKRGYFFNHYEKGHVIKDCPTPLFETQEVWLTQKWLSKHTYIKEGVIL